MQEFGQMEPTYPERERERGDKPATVMHKDSIEPGAQSSLRGQNEIPRLLTCS